MYVQLLVMFVDIQRIGSIIRRNFKVKSIASLLKEISLLKLPSNASGENEGKPPSFILSLTTGPSTIIIVEYLSAKYAKPQDYIRKNFAKVEPGPSQPH